jgi:hypothetical protein
MSIQTIVAALAKVLPDGWKWIRPDPGAREPFRLYWAHGPDGEQAGPSAAILDVVEEARKLAAAPRLPALQPTSAAKQAAPATPPPDADPLPTEVTRAPNKAHKLPADESGQMTMF